ncbi:MAG: hypothetical protein ICV63_05225, partial [Coleofasciculus sp. Co-bin14]|nr:hypothetical protein [Coleofasciculus sp. Co-bin14]
MRRASQFSVLMLLVLAAMLMFSLSGSTQADTNTLHFLAQKRGLGIGTAVAMQLLTNSCDLSGSNG